MESERDLSVFNAFVIRILDDPEFAADVTQLEDAIVRRTALNAFLDDMEARTGKEFLPRQRAQALEDFIQVLSTTDLHEIQQLRMVLNDELEPGLAL